MMLPTDRSIRINPNLQGIHQCPYCHKNLGLMEYYYDLIYADSASAALKAAKGRKT